MAKKNGFMQMLLLRKKNVMLSTLFQNFCWIPIKYKYFKRLINISIFIEETPF